MRFPRNARMLRSQLDVAPFAGVFFLLLMFLILGALLPTPGLELSLPAADDLPGTGKPSVAVAIDAAGQFYFANQMVSETELESCLRAAKENSAEPLTLIVQADKAVPYGQFFHLALLARRAGIQDAQLATLPRLLDAAPEQP